jgi:hypothetical protein
VNTPKMYVVCTALLGCAISGCNQSGASAGSAPVPVTASAQNILVGAMPGMTMMVGGAGQTARVGATRDEVWARLPGAYEWLGLPLGFKDDARYRLGNDQIKMRRALNGMQVRTLVDCGSDLNGEKAESYEIRLTIETTVSVGPTAAAADVTTTVSALGRSPSFGNGDVTCSTKGDLEKRILRYVRVQLGLSEK